MKVEEIDEKCSKVQWFQLKSAKLPMNDEQRNWFDKFLTDHNELCDQIKRKLRKRKLKREYIDATQDFVKLESFKNYVIDSSLNDLWAGEISFVQMDVAAVNWNAIKYTLFIK